MEVMTAIQAAEKWGVSLRWVQNLLKDNRIGGAVRLGRDWLIPADAEKPGDPRRAAKSPQKQPQKPRQAKAPSRSVSPPATAQPQPFAADFAAVLAATYIPTPRKDPGALLDIVGSSGKRLQAVPEIGLAFWRGDFEHAIRRYRQISGDDALKLCCSQSAISAAICAGDYPFFAEIEAFLKECATAHRNTSVAAFAELALATAYTGAMAPDMVAGWLKNGDFTALPNEVKLDALYLRARYFQSLGQYDAMLATAQAALCFCDPNGGLTTMEVNLQIACAVALIELGRTGEAEPYLLSAMRSCLPYGFPTLIAINMPMAGGHIERLLQREAPRQAAAVMALAQRAVPGWFIFHNCFTQENITHILPPRDYQMARLVARRVPYTEIAKQFQISPGRMKNKMNEIYGKLYVSNRDELAKIIL